METKTKILAFCFIVFLILAADFLMFNVHISTFYVQQQATLYPANISISPECFWSKNGSFGFDDYKPTSFILIARMLSVTYKRYGIIPILRDGSFLHTFRRVKADKDMDIFLIVPRNITLRDAYTKIRNIIKTDAEFKDIKLETTNIILSGILFDKSDAVRISFNGEKIVDVNVLHETFINDPDLQTPCLKQMHCKKHFSEINDAYIEANKHYLQSKALFESLCVCLYMDSPLFCFNVNGAKYLEIRYGGNFTVRRNSLAQYSLIYERPHKSWRSVLATLPSLMKLKKHFEGHKDEHNCFLTNETTRSI